MYAFTFHFSTAMKRMCDLISYQFSMLFIFYLEYTPPHTHTLIMTYTTGMLIGEVSCGEKV